MCIAYDNEATIVKKGQCNILEEEFILFFNKNCQIPRLTLRVEDFLQYALMIYVRLGPTVRIKKGHMEKKIDLLEKRQYQGPNKSRLRR